MKPKPRGENFQVSQLPKLVCHIWAFGLVFYAWVWLLSLMFSDLREHWDINGLDASVGGWRLKSIKTNQMICWLTKRRVGRMTGWWNDLAPALLCAYSGLVTY